MASRGGNKRMPSRILIQGGRIIDPANGIDQMGDICVANGRIVSVIDVADGFQAERVIDAGGQIVCPSFIDLCARPREPGQEYKATIASETRAAASGGITTLVCPPDTQPVIDTPAVVELIRTRAEQAGFACVLPLGALTQNLAGEQISEMMALRDAGVIGVSNGPRPVANTLVLRRAMEYAATHDMLLVIRPEDGYLRGDGCVHEGPLSTRLGLVGIPEAAETVAVARDLALIEQIGCRAHFGQLSTARAVQMIQRAQHNGLPISADVSAHHLHLTATDVREFDSSAHVQPPLRTERDRDALRNGLISGAIGAVCSDHQPHEVDAKQAPFPETEPGISGLDTLLPLVLRLARDGLLDLPRALALITSQPAEILGIEAGSLSVGGLANICVFDPDRHWTVSADTLRSQGHNTPFIGWEMQGRVNATLLRGKVVFERG